MTDCSKVRFAQLVGMLPPDRRCRELPVSDCEFTRCWPANQIAQWKCIFSPAGLLAPHRPDLFTCFVFPAE